HPMCGSGSVWALWLLSQFPSWHRFSGAISDEPNARDTRTSRPLLRRVFVLTLGHFLDRLGQETAVSFSDCSQITLSHEGLRRLLPDRDFFFQCGDGSLQPA